MPTLRGIHERVLDSADWGNKIAETLVRLRHPLDEAIAAAYTHEALGAWLSAID